MATPIVFGAAVWKALWYTLAPQPPQMRASATSTAILADRPLGNLRVIDTAVNLHCLIEECG
jgi:hypothetical protein